MARWLLKRYGAAPGEAVWPDSCRSALARGLRKRYGAISRKRYHTKTALWRDACGRALVRCLRKRYDASSTEALWRVD